MMNQIDTTQVDDLEFEDQSVGLSVKQVNNFFLKRHFADTERLKILRGFIALMLPGYATILHMGQEFTDNDHLPPSIRAALERAVVSALGQIDRITNTDLEPLEV